MNRINKTLTFFFVFLCFLSVALPGNGQKNKKQYTITRLTGEAPKIDGHLDDQAWDGVPEANGFTRYQPYNGQPASQSTAVKILYDDHAIYVGAMLYDTQPDSIMRGLAPRDSEHGAMNADVFIIELNPYNDDQMLFSFHVSASGVQMDQRVTHLNWDWSWDAVWQSQVSITKNGWIAELKIPFSALRIPRMEEQTWGMHMWRYIKRHEEWSSWNPVDNKIPGSTHQVGLLTGINNIKPPLRLSLTPYLSGSTTANTGQLPNASTLKGGLDLKYGINQSFTLDMMLIPDFGQVPTDDAVLNLTSVETFYNEKRSFFNEGSELFSKAGIFYSRRIGARPQNFYGAYNQLKENETITDNPAETQIINATKLSGRTTKGTGLGFLNAITANTYARARNGITGEARRIKTQPLTNYNVMVIDQRLKNNSSISLINTNVSAYGNSNLSNVTGTEFRFNTPQNHYALYGKGAISHIDREYQNKETGFFYDIAMAKTAGQFKAELGQRLVSDTYNSNDLGYLEFNNELTNFMNLDYNIYEPFWKIKSLYNRISFRNHNLYHPTAYGSFEIDASSSATFFNELNISILWGVTPIKKYDHYEPRVKGWKYEEPTAFYVSANASTDNKKRISLFSEILYWRANEYNKETLYFTLRPTFRVGSKLTSSLEVNTQFLENAIGFVNKSSDNSEIYFGRRDIRNIANTWTLNYIFNNKSALSVRARHYWSTVDYKQFYRLKKDGTLDNTFAGQPGNNINFNNIATELLYRWQFAPGSELSLMWRNLIGSHHDQISDNYFKNLADTYDSDKQNIFSFKVLYYLDFHSLKRSMKRDS